MPRSSPPRARRALFAAAAAVLAGVGTGGALLGAGSAFAATPTFSSAASDTVTVNQMMSFSVSATSTPGATITEVGTLPTGLNFLPGANASGTATLSGAPTQAGTFTFSFVANDGVDPVTTQSFTLTVNGTSAGTPNLQGTVLAGQQGPASFDEGGPVGLLSLYSPSALAMSSSGTYLADTKTVRFVPKTSGTYYGQTMTGGDVYTVAGTGVGGAGGNGVPAVTANIGTVAGIATDTAGDIFVADSDNNVIDFIPVASCSASCPFGLAATTAGDIYTIAGTTGTPGESGTAVAATSAEIYANSVVTDASGNVYIGGSGAIRMVAAASCSASCPFGLASTTAGDIYTIAGTLGTTGYSGDGSAALGAQMDNVAAVVFDGSGDLLFVDQNNDVVRMIAATTCASSCPFGLASTTAGDIYTIAGDQTLGGGSYSGAGGAATSADLPAPAGLTVDAAGDVVVSLNGGPAVALVAQASCVSSCPFGLASMTAGDIYTIAGVAGVVGTSGDNAGPGTSAQFVSPAALASDASGNVYLLDTSERSVTAIINATCSTPACPFGLTSATSGWVYTVIGTPDVPPGIGYPASVLESYAPSGVAVDAAGAVAVADINTSEVYFTPALSGTYYGQTMTGGHTYVVAGDSEEGGWSGNGGPATSAKLGNPASVTFDAAGDLLIADQANNQIRMVAAATCSSNCAYGLASTTAGDIYAVAGDGTAGYAGDSGAATSAQLSSPAFVAIDGAGNLLIADQGNYVIRLVAAATCSSNCAYGLASTTAGDIYTIAGTHSGGGTTAGDGGLASLATFGALNGLAVDANGDLIIADASEIRMVAAATCSSACPYGLAATTAAHIYSIASGISANVLAADAAGNVYFVPNGNFVDVLAASSGQVDGLSLSAGQSAVLAGGGAETTSGHPSWADAVTSPSALAVASSGTLYLQTEGAQNGLSATNMLWRFVVTGTAPAITSPATMSCTVGTACTFTVTTTGTAPMVLTETGTLPAGLNFTDNGNGTATVAGTATAAGTFTVTVEAANGISPAASDTLDITVAAAPGGGGGGAPVPPTTTVPAPSGSTPGTPTPTPAVSVTVERIDHPTTGNWASKASARTTLTCVAACTAQVTLSVHGTVIGTAAISESAGTHVVAVHLNAAGVALLAAHPLLQATELVEANGTSISAQVVLRRPPTVTLAPLALVPAYGRWTSARLSCSQRCTAVVGYRVGTTVIGERRVLVPTGKVVSYAIHLAAEASVLEQHARGRLVAVEFATVAEGGSHAARRLVLAKATR